MTPATFKAELVGLINRAKQDLEPDDLLGILYEEVHDVQGLSWLKKHYNGDVPPRLPEPRLVKPDQENDNK
jgi:hypothetical protein